MDKYNQVLHDAFYRENSDVRDPEFEDALAAKPIQFTYEHLFHLSIDPGITLFPFLSGDFGEITTAGTGFFTDVHKAARAINSLIVNERYEILHFLTVDKPRLSVGDWLVLYSTPLFQTEAASPFLHVLAHWLVLDGVGCATLISGLLETSPVILGDRTPTGLSDRQRVFLTTLISCGSYLGVNIPSFVLKCRNFYNATDDRKTTVLLLSVGLSIVGDTRKCQHPGQDYHCPFRMLLSFLNPITDEKFLLLLRLIRFPCYSHIPQAPSKPDETESKEYSSLHSCCLLMNKILPRDSRLTDLTLVTKLVDKTSQGVAVSKHSVLWDKPFHFRLMNAALRVNDFAQFFYWYNRYKLIKEYQEQETRSTCFPEISMWTARLQMNEFSSIINHVDCIINSECRMLGFMRVLYQMVDNGTVGQFELPDRNPMGFVALMGAIHIQSANGVRELVKNQEISLLHMLKVSDDSKENSVVRDVVYKNFLAVNRRRDDTQCSGLCRNKCIPYVIENASALLLSSLTANNILCREHPTWEERGEPIMKVQQMIKSYRDYAENEVKREEVDSDFILNQEEFLENQPRATPSPSPTVIDFNGTDLSASYPEVVDGSDAL